MSKIITNSLRVCYGDLLEQSAKMTMMMTSMPNRQRGRAFATL
ncbi:MAG TPA: hypothetical protein VFR94_02210 [Nitrososphaeraceae archaeon]|nr:hypothetical protein [Nitrososphaeraceae archaeon]